ncbi:hypothetical protein HHK36_025580 [Tetracentron sinense]|uniref:C3H1-type domain-containing protein n=1 Tax=Tetracentron sinense TaxID=13715 RepID=A0A834YHS5_TETSI|nr:hypothetical protein HHK36_025580 [Tetracentron sinense]
MIIGEIKRPKPTVHVPPWTLFDDLTARMAFSLPVSGVSGDANVSGGEYYPSLLEEEPLTALQRYVPSNYIGSESDISGCESDMLVDAYSCDEFRMYEFKVRRCVLVRSHDWTECPYAHSGEKARRRDPRKFHYSGIACPDFRKGNCKRGDSCEFAHGVFECWLHPARYRTQPCKDRSACRRRVCFFAHTPEQLRVLPQHSSRTLTSADSYDGSPIRLGFDSFLAKGSFISSPTSTLISPASDSPPMSPNSNSLCRSLSNLKLCKEKSGPSSWGFQMGSGIGSALRPGFGSLPSTPTRTPTRSGIGYFDFWEIGCEEEPVMERVESGRDLRAKVFEKLSKENSIERVDSPDVG